VIFKTFVDTFTAEVDDEIGSEQSAAWKRDAIDLPFSPEKS